MSDQTRQPPSRVLAYAELTGAEVFDTYDEQDDEDAILLRLHGYREDGVQFQKQVQWDLIVDRDVLVQIAQKILAAIDPR